MEKTFKKVWFTDKLIYAMTADGEIFSQKLEVYPSLLEATPEQRNNFEIWDNNQSIRWEELDEDIHITDLLEPDTVDYDNDVNKLLSRFPYLDLKAFAEYLGMNWTKLARYKYGVWRPSQSEFDEIKNGIHQIGQDMLAVM